MRSVCVAIFLKKFLFMFFISIVRRPLFCIARRAVIDSLSVNNVGKMNVECPFCHAFHWLDERVSSSSISHPEFEMCCAHGKIRLPPLCMPPTELYDLFVNNTPAAREFRSNIVQYNSVLAFTSMGVDIDR